MWQLVSHIAFQVTKTLQQIHISWILYKFFYFAYFFTSYLLFKSLAKLIVSIVTNNRENQLKELKEHFLDRKHLQHIIEYSLNNDSITFIRTYNRKHNINFKKFHSCLDKIKSKELKTCFIHYTTSKLTKTLNYSKIWKIVDTKTNLRS